jgi:CBS domain-containing protein
MVYYGKEKEPEEKNMRSIREILKEKGGDIWTMDPNATVFQALELMSEKNIGAVLVIEEDALVGILSERDYARKVALKGKGSRETRVREIMTGSVLFVKPEQSVEECMAIMTNKHIRHLPVLDGGRLIGLVSIGDIVKAVIAEQTFMIEQLTNYITGKTR